MRFHTAIIDNFLDHPRGLLNSLNEDDFRDIKISQDGVSYPGINPDLPPRLLPEITEKLKTLGLRPKPELTFFRLSTKGMNAPHQAHTDAVMAEFTLIVYLNEHYPAGSGTSILMHETGMSRTPKDEVELNTWKTDCNSPQFWRKLQMCDMKFNRALICDSDLFHRSEPIGSFGSDLADGRLVLISFMEAV